MLKITSSKRAASDIPLNKVPGFINSTAPEMILNKLKNKVNEIIADDSWSGAESDQFEINALIEENPKYSDYIYRYTANAIDDLLSSYDSDVVEDILDDYDSAFRNMHPQIDEILNKIRQTIPPSQNGM